MRRFLHVEARIQQLGYSLKQLPSPKANYIPICEVGNILYVSGRVPFDKNGQMIVGKVGREFSMNQSYEISKSIGLDILSLLQAHLGDLDRLEKVVKLTGFVNCIEDYDKCSQTINGCSDVLTEILGFEKGAHSRSAVGVMSLPFNVPVEIEAIVICKK